LAQFVNEINAYESDGDFMVDVELAVPYVEGEDNPSFRLGFFHSDNSLAITAFAAQDPDSTSGGFAFYKKTFNLSVITSNSLTVDPYGVCLIDAQSITTNYGIWTWTGSPISTSLFICGGTSTDIGTETTDPNTSLQRIGSLDDLSSNSWTGPLTATPGTINTGQTISATVGGDPHITKWNGKKYSYHGECDLVYVTAPSFEGGLGLDIHIRTTIDTSFSFVEAVAIKVGDFVVNINKYGLWVDNIQISDFPVEEGPFEITTVGQKSKMPIYAISVMNKKVISVKVPGHGYLFVQMFAHDIQPKMMHGLMGEYPSGKLIGRDGVTEFVNTNEYGEEWQVQPYEDMLFLEARGSQFTGCRYPDRKVVTAARKLRSKAGLDQIAKEACRHLGTQDYELCVEDVMTTGDVGIAAGY